MEKIFFSKSMFFTLFFCLLTINTQAALFYQHPQLSLHKFFKNAHPDNNNCSKPKVSTIANLEQNLETTVQALKENINRLNFFKNSTDGDMQIAYNNTIDQTRKLLSSLDRQRNNYLFLAQYQPLSFKKYQEYNGIEHRIAMLHQKPKSNL